MPAILGAEGAQGAAPTAVLPVGPWTSPQARAAERASPDTNLPATTTGADGADGSPHDGGDLEPADNDDQPPPHGPQQTRLWPTSSLTLPETIADLRKGLAQLQPLYTSTTTTTTTTTEADAATVSTDMIRTSLEHLVTTAMLASSSRTAADVDVLDKLSRGPLASPAEQDAAVDSSLFRVPPRFAVPASPPSPSTLPATVTSERSRTQDHGDSPRGGSSTQQQGRNNALATSLTARRLVQLTGPGSPLGPPYQTAPAGSVTWPLDGVVRSHGASAPVHTGSMGGLANMTGVVGQRGSVTGTLAGSLHGGVNVLLGGAMLSGLILLVFFICYCCQRSARKSDAHFRTQYWLPDPDGPLEVFTLDAQTQRLERAGAVLIPSEPMDPMALSPSPPPAYHTVVNLPPLPPPSKPTDAGVLSAASSPTTTDGILAKGLCPATSATGLAEGLASGEVDADGLPSYEAALKLESQGHM